MKIPVLYYHEVVPKGQGYTYQKIEEEEFEQQLRYLKEHGYATITFEDAYKGVVKVKKPIILTFDDGFKTVYQYAYPLLKKYGMKATLFLAPKYIDENNNYYLTWDMIRKMKTEIGIEIGSHTYTHIDVRSLHKEALLEEFRQADQAIEREVGITPKVICFPYGVFDIKTLRALKEYGHYRYYVASFFGRTNFIFKKKLIQRIGIKNGDSLNMFDRKLNGKESYRGIVQLLRIVKSTCLHRYQSYRIDF